MTPLDSVQALVEQLELLQRGKDFTSEPIEVLMSGPQLCTITVVDLPGYVDSPPQTSAAIRRINNTFIGLPGAIIVWVRKAQDWETDAACTALRCIKEVDPHLQRTVCATTQMQFNFNQIAPQLPQYLYGSNAAGHMFHEGCIKFFMDVALVSSGIEGSRMPLPFPQDPQEAAQVLDSATTLLRKR